MMKRTMSALLLGLLLAAPALHAAPLALGTAMPLPDQAMKNVDGSMVTLQKAAGAKGTLVIFACNHCPWVQAWQDRIAAIGNEAMKQGVGVVMVNSNDPKAFPTDGFAEMVERAKQVGYQFPYVVDEGSKLARAFGATHTPEAFLFDKSGKLVYHGTVDDNAQNPEAVTKHFLKDAVEAVAAGFGLGCGIKYQS